MAGLPWLSATEICLVASSEPITAVAAFVFLGVILSDLRCIGGALIVLAVAQLASRKVEGTKRFSKARSGSI